MAFQFTFGANINRNRAIAADQAFREKQLTSARQDSQIEAMRGQLDSLEKTAREEAERYFEMMHEAALEGNTDAIEQMMPGLSLSASAFVVPMEKIKQFVISQNGPQQLISGIEDRQRSLMTSIAARADAIQRASRVLHTPDAEDPNVQNFMVDGEMVGIDITSESGQEQLKDVLNRGGVRVGLNVQSGSAEELGLGFGGRSATQRGTQEAESDERLTQAVDAINALRSVGEGVSSAPRSVGFLGFVNEKVGGPLGQVSENLGRAFSVLTTGTDPQRASQIRGNLRLLVAQNLSLITGEQSGRFTETERTIADNTIRALPVDANAQQLMGALGTLFSLNLQSESRELTRQGKPQRFKVVAEAESEENTMVFPDGTIVNVVELDKLDEFLRSAGITSDDVLISIATELIRAQQREVRRIGSE